SDPTVAIENWLASCGDAVRKAAGGDGLSAAASFNIFRALGVASRETVHSSFLAHLFDPRGAHQQKGLFLKSFFTFLREERHSSCWIYPADDWTVCTEHDCRPFRARLDLLLQSADRSVIVVIENKIFARDHDGQLDEYAE